MDKNLNAFRGGMVSTLLLIAFLGFVAFLGLTNRRFLWMTSTKSAVITIGFIGMALCARGIGRVAEASAWLSPFSILAYLIGGIIIALTLLIWLDQSIPIIETPRNALIAILGLIGVKFVISNIHRLFLR